MLVIAVILGFSSPSASAATPKDKTKVILHQLAQTDDLRKVLVPAKVEARVQSLVSAEIEGNVTRILKPLGSSVKAGETILLLQNREAGFTYAAVPVKAPVSGIVSQLWPAEMAKVSRGDRLFSVMNPRSSKVIAEVSSADVSTLSVGIQGNFKIDSTGESVAVRLTALSPVIDPRTGTAPAELEFTNAKNLPALGSIGQVRFDVPKGKIVLVPTAALMFKDGKPVLRVLKADGTTERKPIEIGEERETEFVLKAGLKPGDRIIVRASRPVTDGEPVDSESTSSPQQK